MNEYYSKQGGSGGNRVDCKLLLEDKTTKKYPVLIEFKGYKNKLVKLNDNGQVENKTDKETYIELLSSFALKKLKADRIHRATSFWSAEGKLLSQDLTELNFERSWANHGFRIERFGQIGSMPVRKWFLRL